MSEYIIECDKYNYAIFLPYLKEEIVRCRDCKWFCEERRCTSVGWNDVFTCYSDQWSTSSLMPSHKVEPDGFCAWGKRKEGGE